MSFGRKGVISINTPDIPAEEIKGVKVCKLGAVEYDQWFEEISRGGDSKTYRYRGTPSELDHWTGGYGREAHKTGICHNIGHKI